MTRKQNINPVEFVQRKVKVGEALAKMGYTSLRDGQEQPLNCILMERDTICIMPTGAGKCLDPYTKVLMWDGTVKCARDIAVGDKLTGVSASIRTVQSITSGEDDMYSVEQDGEAPYVVNSKHILTLRCNIDKLKLPSGTTVRRGDLVDMSVLDFIAWQESTGDKDGLVRACDEIYYPMYENGVFDAVSYVHNPKTSVAADRSFMEFVDAIAAASDTGELKLPTRQEIKSLESTEDEDKSFPDEYDNDYEFLGMYSNLCVPGYTPKIFTEPHAPYKARVDFVTGFLNECKRRIVHYSTTSGAKNYVEMYTKVSDNWEGGDAFRRIFQSVGMRVRIDPETSFIRDATFVVSGDFSKFKLRDYKVNASWGVKPTPKMTIRPLGKGPYSGFMLDGDGRFLLGDYTITHNSAIFQLPIIAAKWRAIVFCPLIALMRDQVNKANLAGIKSACVNGDESDSMNYNAMSRWRDGALQLLYIAPERLNNEMFLNMIKDCPPDFVVLDEAHCISEWSDNFRPAYKKCGTYILEWNPKVIAAFTATATDKVIEDIERVLNVENPAICRHYPIRQNLKLSGEVLNDSSQLRGKVLKWVRDIKGACIVYCPTIGLVNDIYKYLESLGESVVAYNGGMNATDKKISQDAFMCGRARICVATNAFGMGIDKPDIEGIIHAGAPSSIEAVAQETGRAARDGREAKCHMFLTEDSKNIQMFFWSRGNPTGDIVLKVAQYVQYLSNNGENTVTRPSTDFVDEVQDESAANALVFLTACGCITRESDDAKLYKITCINSDVPQSQVKLYGLVQEYGELISTSAEGHETYSIDIEYLSDKVGLKQTTVKSKLRSLANSGHINYIAPSKVAVTTFLRLPTEDELRLADKNRSDNMRKLLMVRNYVTTPDENKQQFLQDYFTIQRDVESDI